MLDFLFKTRLRRNTLERVLYDFQEPFDKKKAIYEMSYGDMAKPDFKQLLFFYDLFYSFLFDILETVYTPSIKSTKKLVPPHKIVGIDFWVIFHLVEQIESDWRFLLIKKLDLHDFDRLEGDQERILKAWKSKRGLFLDHIAYIKECLMREKVRDYPIPYRVERYKKAIYHNLNKQKQFQKARKIDESLPDEYIMPDDFIRDDDDKRVYYFGQHGEIAFTSRNSARLKIFDKIFRAKGGWIELSEVVLLLNRLLKGNKKSKTTHHVRQEIIDGLRPKLKEIGFTIELSGETPSKVRIVPVNIAGRHS